MDPNVTGNLKSSTASYRNKGIGGWVGFFKINPYSLQLDYSVRRVTFGMQCQPQLEFFEGLSNIESNPNFCNLK